MNKTIIQIWKKINFLIPDRIFILLNYYIRFKRLPNLKNPTRYSEKIQLAMISDEMTNYTSYVDKYEVRKFVEEKIGSKYLVNLLGVYNSSDEINFDALPEKFILKTNHGSGYYIICNDKKTFDVKKCRRTLNQWIKENYYNKCREKQYKYIKRKIICEELIENIDKDFLDFRVFCFKGKPVFIQLDKGFSEGKTQRLHYDLEWNLLEFDMKWPRMDEEVNRPENLSEILDLARKLCENFNHVRVDFYLSQNKVYFSELTFTPSGGRNILKPDKYDLILGEMM